MKLISLSPFFNITSRASDILLSIRVTSEKLPSVNDSISASIFMSIVYSYKSIKKQFKKLKKTKKYLKTIIIILAVLIISFYISKITPAADIDPYADYDFNQILDSASINKTQYIDNLTAVLAQDNSNFAKAIRQGN